MPNLLEHYGASPNNKKPRFVPLFMDRAFTGLFTHRAALHDPSDLGTLKYYGGRPDSLWMGSNIELTNRMTLQRRPGLSPFSTATYPSAPDRAFSFELINGTIQVIIDTGPTNFIEKLAVTQVAKSSGGQAVYLGVFPDGANNAYVGMSVTITGFLTAGNNGTFTVLASTLTTITLSNASATPEITAAIATLTRTQSISQVAQSSGGQAVYIGTFGCGGANNGFVGMIFTVSGFLTANNNGSFTVVASTTTTLTLTNAQATPEIGPASAISAGAVYYDQQNGSKTLLFGKSAGAGQTSFVAVAGVLYMGDGVDIRKYTPLNTNGTIWLWGIVAPSQQPGVVVTQTASVSAVWTASTFYSTMGIIIVNNTAQQLVSINADLKNPNTNTTIGVSGNGSPIWPGVGGTVVDNTITWTNRGPIDSRFASTGYNGITSGGTNLQPAVIYDPTSGGFYENSRTGTGFATDASKGPPFTGTIGEHFFDGACNWVCFANNSTPQVYRWQKSHVYGNFLSTFDANSCIIEPTVPPFPPGTFLPPFPGPNTTYLMTSGGGTSKLTPYTPNFSTVKGQATPDGQLSWISLGSSQWAPNTPYSAWTSAHSPTFDAVVDASGNLWVCTRSGTSTATNPFTAHLWQALHVYAVGDSIVDTNGFKQTVTTSGTSGAAHPTWNKTPGGTTPADGTVTWTNQGPAYNFTVNDGVDVIWTCVGTAAAATWTAAQNYYLPLNGFVPPSTSQPFGGAAVFDATNTEFVVNTGVSQTPGPPGWNATVGGLTTDNTITWVNTGVPAVNSFSWTSGLVYAYSFKARALTDFYSVNVPGTNKPPVPPGLLTQITNGPLPPPTGSETGAVSTASPANVSITGGNTGAVVTVSGFGSTDPQVDTIIIWRSTDGGGVGNMFELTEIPSPPPINGVAQPWMFQDYLPQNPKIAADGTTLFPGLNPLIPAPINHVNDPPASNFRPMVYNFQRIWGAEGQQVNFSGGPDTRVGNPNEAFNPADELPFLSNVVNLVKNTQGIVTFLTNSIELIAGGPFTASFFSVTLCPSVGLMSFNALDVHAGEIYFFSADNQFYALSPSLSLSRSGFPIGDQLANFPSSGVSDAIWNSSNVYVAVHQNGLDNCIFLADGSTGWYHVNPYQTPGGYQGPEPVWSPYANITNGCKMVQSVETSPGIKKLLVGPVSGCSQILYRNLAVFTDNGVPYGANFTMGSIMLVHPGQMAVLKFLEMDYSGKRFQPKVSFMLNEIAGTFTPFTTNPQFDPPSIYGTTGIPGSYSPNRYYFSTTKSLARCRHMQIRVDFGVTPNPDEMFNMTIFGRLLSEF
jgi:hypothetical protein